MIELGQLEKAYQEFFNRHARIVAVSIEDAEDARATQADFPHLTIVSDANRKMAEAIQVIHPHSAPDGGDTSAPTTLIVDGDGVVRWTFRPTRFLTRLTPDEVLAAMDEHLGKGS